MVSFLIGARTTSFYLMLDMGIGKTAVALNLIRYRMQQGLVRRALILVPGVANVGEWIEQGSIHTPDLTVEGLRDDTQTRTETLLGYSNILVVTYMGWLAMVCSRQPTGNGKRRMQIEKKLAHNIERMFDFVVFDESTSLKNNTTLTFSACRRLSRLPFKLALSGTPFGTDPQDLWSQFYALDRGETLGKTLGLFRAGYCTEKENYWTGFSEYKFDKRKHASLRRAIQNRSIRYSADDCLDLPPSVGGIRNPMYRRADLPKETLVYYTRIVEELKALGSGEMPQIEGVYVKMRQITAGFLIAGDTVIKFRENPKLELLVGLLREVPTDCKVLVYNEFHVSGDLICERLKKEKIGHVRMYGKTPRKDEVVARFKQDPKAQVLVGSRTVAFGLNLQVANYVAFFESPDSLILREQFEKRVRRPGQGKTTFYYDLALRGTVDEKIVSVLHEGRNLHDVLIDGGRALI